MDAPGPSRRLTLTQIFRIAAREDQGTAGIPFVMLTAESRFELLQAARRDRQKLCAKHAA
jgi:hypothetical protein